MPSRFSRQSPCAFWNLWLSFGFLSITYSRLFLLSICLSLLVVVNNGSVIQTHLCSTMFSFIRFASHSLRGHSEFWRCFTCHNRPVWWSIPTRSISTTLSWNAALATKPQSHPTIVLSSPSAEYIRKEDLDVEVLPPQDVRLVITDRAAEVICT